tara:strand:- start:43563 stop:44960 length:1398 start_codon:yes stop_codon:yes gene_type:complete
MKRLSFFFLIPLFGLSQSTVNIEHLDGPINTYGADLNFFQFNDSSAYYTAMTEENNYQSSIYLARKKRNKWKRTGYSQFNSEKFNTGDICFLNNNEAIFSFCDLDENCKLIFFSEGNFSKINTINNIGKKNIQGNLTNHKNQKVLYFVSDRQGGFGGLDIWLSIIDVDGNFGVPINAGSTINTSSDEITPFFNVFENKLYFSSNREGGVGGFDVYRSLGRLNLWNKVENVTALNSKEDEMYLVFYDKDNGYFSSNRKGARYKNNEYCCNDIFSFRKFSLDTIKEQYNWEKFKMITLYFHNDEPDYTTVDLSTRTNYKECYVSYFKKQDEYNDQNNSLIDFFESNLKYNYNRLIKLLDGLTKELKLGKTIELQLRGYASPLHKFEYNIDLSQRRIQSVINFIKIYQNSTLVKYLDSHQLSVVELPLGESKAPLSTSDNPNDISESVYSLEAMLERKVEIVKVILKK